MNKIEIIEFLKSAIREDLGRGDLFSQIIESNKGAVKAIIKAKEDGIFSGYEYAKPLCDMYDISCNFFIKDTESFAKDSIIAELHGQYNSMLIIERLLLNILQHSSGIATLTRKYVDKLQGYNVALLDTRKTRPLLRSFEKYSVRSGGAMNHRMGLDSMLMLKDTHLSQIQNLADFIKKARKSLPFGISIEIEVSDTHLAQIALEQNIDILMCDNMTLDNIKAVVNMRDSMKSRALIEASGNITLQNITEVARCGVDAISSGSLIHKATWLDMSMKML